MLLSDAMPQIHFLLLCIIISSTQSRGYKTFQAYNRYAKKCLSIFPSGLQLEDCTLGVNKLIWIENMKLKGVKSSCIQAMKNTSLTTGDCSSQDTVRWTCQGSALRSQSGNWYISWNAEKNEIKMTKTVNGLQGQWLLYQTDNNICYFLPQSFPTTSVPFNQPAASPRLREGNSAVQLWPRGNYALPKAASGCPGSSNFTWKEGWVFQDLDDNGEIKTKSSSSFHMAANIDDYGNIKRWFCSKNVTKDENNNRPPWPKGTYCIYSSYYSSSMCPESEEAFDSGFVIWDNQYWINNSKKKGMLPRGVYTIGGTTHINFCCQSNNDPNAPVSLPTDQPFYLLAYRSSVCQKVKWATVIPEFVVYDTSDFRNHDKVTAFTPFNARNNDPVIYYCYYQGCNHTLNLTDKEEKEINFPQSPFMDMISQSCSWRIQLPSEFVISMDFLHFNIPSKQPTNCSSQFMEIFDGEEHAERSLGKWCGARNVLPFYSQSNSVLIILKLDENITSTTGFRLNFKSISTQKITSKEPDKEITTIESERNESSTPTSNPDISLAKVSGRPFPTTTVAVAVVVAVVIFVIIGIILVALMKRRKTVNRHILTFQNSACIEYENPIYKGELKYCDDAASHVSIYESVDNDIISPQHNISNTSKLTLGELSDDLNPLYESSGQAEYASAMNSLYNSCDC